MEKKLNADIFSNFMRCISVLKDTCNDIDIRDGFVRQRNNTYSCIFELDLNPLIGCVNLPIACLKQKIDILKTFNKCDVDIDINEKSFSFADEYSKIIFDNPNYNFMDNKYITPEEYNSMVLLNPEDLIMRYDLEKVITDRIKKISQAFDINNVKIVFKDNKASLVSTSQSKDQEAQLVKDIEIHKDLNCNANIIITPLIIDHDGPIIISVYEIDGNSCICKFETKIADVDICIVTRSPLLEDNF
jgi:hypothetical protein